MCSWWFKVQNPYQIGGPGQVVEIDESIIDKRKNNVEREVEQRWVFGDMEKATNRGFLEMVPDRIAATFLNVIQNRIVPGSIILSNLLHITTLLIFP